MTKAGRPRHQIKYKSLAAQLLDEAAGCNRSSFARTLGISIERLSHYVHGRQIPRLTIAIMLEDKYGIPAVTWMQEPIIECPLSNKSAE